MANNLIELRRANPTIKPPLAEVRQALKSYEQDRQYRTNYICDRANNSTRIEAMATLKDKIFVKYLLPRAGDFLVDQSSDAFVGATGLDSLPVPARSVSGTMPFDANAGIGRKENKWWRALYGLPLFGAAFYCRHILRQVLCLTPSLSNKAFISSVTQAAGGASVPLRSSFYAMRALDSLIRHYTPAFTPFIGDSDGAKRLQMISFMARSHPDPSYLAH
jgi:hypothetical protein